MSATSGVPDFVLRLADVAIDRTALENALRTRLERYEPSRHGPLCYAQVSPDAGGASWSSVAAWLESIAPRLKELIEQRQVGSAVMDLVVLVPDNAVARSMTLPAHIALLAGRNLIDIEFSAYLSSSGH